MIIRPKPNTASLFFIMRGSIVPTIAPRVLAITGWAVAVATLEHFHPGLFKDVSVTPFTLLGIGLSIFLGFRNNACYDRWWEGRKLWGQLIYEMRCIGRETTVLLADDEVKRRQMRRLIGFAHVSNAQLRGGDAIVALAPWVDEDELEGDRDKRNLANAIARRVHAEYAECLRNGSLTDILFQGFSNRLGSISGIQTACERLQNTPLPITYSLLIHRTAFLFCLLLPFAVVASFGWYTPLVSAVIAYAFFGLDALGDELEEPFGTAQNALPLDAMTRVIEIDLLELLDGEEVPEFLKPVDYVLN